MSMPGIRPFIAVASASSLAVSLTLCACNVYEDGYTPSHGEVMTPDPMGLSTGDDAGSTSSASSGDAGASAPVVFDTASVLALVADGGFASNPALAQASHAYPSAAAPGSNIIEYVTASALASYLDVNPDGGPAVTVPVGTTIVRAVLDSSGDVAALTLMSKGPSGYNPALGDWWFGVTDPKGVPQENDAGVEMGLLTGCFTCHVPNANEDFLFGVPSTYQVSR